MSGPTFIFCRRCGAVTKPGICTTCGYDHDAPVEEYEDNDLESNYENGDEPVSLDKVDSNSEDLITASDNDQTFEQGNETPDNENEAVLETSAISEEEFNNSNENIDTLEASEEIKQENTTSENYETPIVQKSGKKKTGFWVYLLGIGIPVVAVLICLLIVVLTVVIPIAGTVFFTASNLGHNSSQVLASEEESEEEDSDNGDASDIDDILDGTVDQGLYGERNTARVYFSNGFDINKYTKGADSYSDTTDERRDIYLKNGYSSSFGTDHTNRERDYFDPPYILQFEESIDENCSYQLERHFLHYENTLKGIEVTANIAYYQIVSDDIPNLEYLNRQIYEQSCNEFFVYLRNGSIYGEYKNITFNTDSFLTYNDEDKLSILLDIEVEVDNADYSGTTYPTVDNTYIYGINADLVDGDIIDNVNIINVDADFAKAFRKQCCEQNGYDIQALNDMSDKTLIKYLSSPNSSIYFLTPLGLEVGYLYRGSSSGGSSTGWMTITLMDYNDLLKDNYRDLFEGTKERKEVATEETTEDNSEENSSEDVSENDSESLSEKTSEKTSEKEKESDSSSEEKKSEKSEPFSFGGSGQQL